MTEPTDLRALRIAAGLTQSELAKRTGLSERTIAAADKGGKVSTKSQIRIRAELYNPAQDIGKPAPRPTTGQQPAPRPADQTGLAARPDPYAPTPPPPGVQRDLEVSGQVIKIDTTRYNDLPVISPQTAWGTVTAVRIALLQFQEGSFMEAADIVEAMLADDRIKGVVSQRIDGLLGLPFTMEPAEEDNELATELAEAAETIWPCVADDSSLRDVWKWGRFLGFGVAEKLYDTESDEGWVPKLKVWHPRYMWWNWIGRKLMINTMDGAVAIWPEADGIHSIDPRTGEESVGHWVLYAPYGFERGWMEGLVRALAIPWLFRQFAYRDWGRYNEVHGIPIRAILEPSEWTDEDKQAALQQVAKLASESIIRLPQQQDKGGYDLKLIEASAQSYDAFRLALDQANSSIAIVVLGQNLTTEVKGGAYSAAQVHERVAAAIIRSDSNTLGTTLKKQVMIEWAALNYGPEAADVAPQPTWDTEPPEDKAQRATAFNTAAQGMATLRKTQLPFDYPKICEKMDLDLIPGAEIPDFVPPAPASPFGGGDGGSPDDGDPAKEPDAKAQRANLQARLEAAALRTMSGAGIVAKMGRRDRAPLQGQVYADQLTDEGRDEAARLLAGDVRAIRKVIMSAKPGLDGKIDAEAIRQELLKAYKGMAPDKLARVLASCQLLAQLSGRYAVVKEVVSE